MHFVGSSFSGVQIHNTGEHIAFLTLSVKLQQVSLSMELSISGGFEVSVAAFFSIFHPDVVWV